MPRNDFEPCQEKRCEEHHGGGLPTRRAQGQKVTGKLCRAPAPRAALLRVELDGRDVEGLAVVGEEIKAGDGEVARARGRNEKCEIFVA